MSMETMHELSSCVVGMIPSAEALLLYSKVAADGQA